MHAPCSNYRSILSSGSYYLEDFDYRSILVDSGIIVHWSDAIHMKRLYSPERAPSFGRDQGVRIWTGSSQGGAKP